MGNKISITIQNWHNKTLNFNQQIKSYQNMNKHVATYILFAKSTGMLWNTNSILDPLSRLLNPLWTKYAAYNKNTHQIWIGKMTA